jgi:hypothetical protein
MSTQQVRNILNTQIDSVLVMAKNRIKEESKKKLNELKEQMPTPQEITKKLLVDINDNSCSDKGKEKFEKKYNKLYELVSKLSNTVGNILETITDIEETIKPIVEGTGPLGTITTIKDFLNDKIMPILQIVILAAPLALGPLTGLFSSAAAADQIQQKRDIATSKVKEYLALLLALPLMITYYQKKAKKIIAPLDIIKSKLSYIKGEIDKTKAFLYSLKLQYDSACSDLENAPNPSVGPTLPDPTGNTELSDYLSLLQEQYNDVYNTLQQANNEKYLKRVYALKENLEEDFNISFEIKNFSN